MKYVSMVLAMALSFQAVAQASRVQTTIGQADQNLAERIKLKQQEVAEAERALNELTAQLAFARGQRDPSGALTLKKVFLVTAVASAAALAFGLATTKLEGQNFPMPVPGRGTFIGLFGLVASGVGYIASDAIEIRLSANQDAQLMADIQQAQAEVAVLKRALSRLQAQ